MRRNTTLILILMTVLIAVYIMSTAVWDYEYVSTVVATVVAALGIFGVCFQLRREATIKESEFLMDFNFTFITTEKFVKLEHRLERYRIHGEPLNLTEDDRQDVIDYLVYLESLAPLVINRMVHLEIVDNLFSYRYFVAVNNPEIQAFELFPEAEFYRGCFEVYSMWKRYKTKKGRPIPLGETGLDKWEKFKKFSTH